MGAAKAAPCRAPLEHINLESEEREAATGRSQNVVHILPQSMDSVPRFLTAPLERVDPAAGALQLVVVTADAEAAVALAEAVLRLTGLGGIELFPVTTARRAARLMQGRPILAVAGAPTDLADLIRGSQLKMQDVRTLVLAWADDVLEGDTEATSALELLMTEVPKEAGRIVVTERPDARVDAFIERYLRRARRIDEREAVDEAEPVAIQYVTVSPASRPGALRRLLDELDPPSAAVVAGSDVEAENVSNLLRALGYTSDGTVQVSRSEVSPNTHAVIFYGIPASRRQLAGAAGANPVALIAIVQPRDLPALRRMAGGQVKPLTLPEAGKTARDRERVLRRELTGVLDSGVPAREILALEPLLDRHDGIEIAAAALRLLERERAARKNADEAGRASQQKREPAAPGPYGRGARSDDSRRGAAERGRPPIEPHRGPSDRGGRPVDARRSPPGRGREGQGRPHRQSDRPSGPRPAGGRPPRDRS
jgi:ATP-dependent RNA helicase DeaD